MSFFCKNPQKKFQEECLKAHNLFRKIHHVPPLTLDNKLNEDCLRQAEILAGIKSDKPKANDNVTEYGENTYTVWVDGKKAKLDGREPTACWYQEGKCYDFCNEPKDPAATKHFTQVIWKSTTHMGAAFAKSDDGNVKVAIVRYRPPGNIKSKYRDNVLNDKSIKQTKALDEKSKEEKRCNEAKQEQTQKRDNPQSCTKAEQKASAATCPECPAGNIEDKPPPPPPPTTNKKQGKQEKTASSSQATLHTLEQKLLQAHNDQRAKHGVPPLKYSSEISKISQRRANQLACDGQVEKNKPCEYGENLYALWCCNAACEISPSSVVKCWYEESKIYNYDDPEHGKSPHFTQIVWRDSKQLGIGMAKSSDNRFFVVAHYSPPGNEPGHYRENVPRPVNK